MVHERPATHNDARELSENLREDDRREISARYGVPPLVALMSGVESCDPCIAIVSDEGGLLGMAGVSSLPDGYSGQAWMLGTDQLRKYSVPFLRKCGPVVDNWLLRYPVLFNHVDARNTLHIKWLRWLGFTFIKRHEAFGVERIPFIEFVRLHDDVFSNTSPDHGASSVAGRDGLCRAECAGEIPA